MKKILSLLNLYSPSKLKSMSFKALDTFHAALEELKNINELSVLEQKRLTREADLIRDNITELENIGKMNAKIITNIEKIIF
jgi:hypothetical protein